MRRKFSKSDEDMEDTCLISDLDNARVILEKDSIQIITSTIEIKITSNVRRWTHGKDQSLTLHVLADPSHTSQQA